MGHAPAKLFRPRRILASLALGLATSIAVCLLLATVLFPSHWTSKTTLDHTKIAPTYLAPIAPDLVEAFILVPGRRASDKPLLWGTNLGVDQVVYSYGSSMWSGAFQPWNPLTTDEPTSVTLTRYRFGWPFRMLSVDEITTLANPNFSPVTDYYQRAHDLAGLHAGLNAPRWMPSSLKLDRIPIFVHCIPLVVNTACWATLWFAILACMNAHIHRRRTRRGLCPTCRYDLQSLPTCPECGQASTPNASASA